MQLEIKEILENSFPSKELFLDSYHSSSICYVLSTDYKLWIIKKRTVINFEVASVAFVRPTNTICMFATSTKYRGMGYGKFFVNPEEMGYGKFLVPIFDLRDSHLLLLW